MKLPLVYFIRNTVGHIKIGYSGVLNERAGKVMPSSPYPCELVATYAHPMARRIEPILHKILRDTRLNGEWHECSLGRALQAIPMACVVLKHRAKGDKPKKKSKHSDARVDDIATFFGNQSRLAEVLGVNRQNVSEWRRIGSGVPPKHHRRIWAAAKEMGKADDLPVWFPRFPETPEDQAA